MNMLLIDDNKETTTMLSTFFNTKGYAVSISNDPTEGLNLIRQEKFDVILLDVNMPVVCGIGIIELLASDDLLKDQNIFIFSEEDIPDIQVKNFLRKDGVNGFVKNPIDPEQLLTVITK